MLDKMDRTRILTYVAMWKPNAKNMKLTLSSSKKQFLLDFVCEINGKLLCATIHQADMGHLMSEFFVAKHICDGMPKS